MVSMSGCIDNSYNSNTWYINQDGSADFTDLQSAINTASDGDTIVISAGEYQSILNITKSVTISSDRNAKFFDNHSGKAIITINSDNVVISGLIIENGSKGIVILGNNCSIISNIIRSNSVGITLSKGTNNNVITNNYLENEINIVGSGVAELDGAKQIGENIIGGQFLGGNYWDDYQGFDINDDGIGDTILPYKGDLNWLNGGDWFPLTNRSLQPEVFVDDDFDPDTAGWNISHFSTLEFSIAAAKDGGMIYIAEGEYEGPVVLNKTLMLLGENRENTIISSNDGFGYGGPLVQILQPNCYLANLRIDASSNIAGRVGIDGESQNTTLVNLTVNDFEYGIRFLFVHGSNTVLSTNIIDCTNGIYTSYSKNNFIKNNNILNCSQYGIFLNAGSDNNLIENNVFRGNDYAMRIKGSTLNLLKYNRLIENNKGIYFCCGARNNTVTKNSFLISKDWHASDQYRNIWDQNGIGNYWDDYEGYDDNGDGVGDVVYTVTDGYSVDRFPIVDLIILDR
jgi:parallel beta-helix repeat protein